jgi:D-alanine-D-alanine ligase
MTSPQRIHVIVLFGGESAEHDVSCVTAAHVLQALDTNKYRITTVGISRQGQWALVTTHATSMASLNKLNLSSPRNRCSFCKVPAVTM